MEAALAFDLGTGLDRGTVILAVGELIEWHRSGRTAPCDESVAFAEFHEVTGALLNTVAPRYVLSPLLSRSFDCIDLAQLLVQEGYRGRYRAVATRLPDPGIIRREIRALCPELDFDVITLNGVAGLTWMI